MPLYTISKVSRAFQEFGKPWLPEYPHLYFSISHSGDWIAGVLASAPVGIDIEKVTTMKTDISSLALTEEECKQLQSLSKAERDAHFLIYGR